jgi:hypothetical protein
MSASKQKAATVTDSDAVEATAFEDIYTSIDELANAGINAVDIEKLKQAGIYTIGGVFQKPKKQLLEIRGFSDVKVRSRHCQWLRDALNATWSRIKQVRVNTMLLQNVNAQTA